MLTLDIFDQTMFEYPFLKHMKEVSAQRINGEGVQNVNQRFIFPYPILFSNLLTEQIYIRDYIVYFSLSIAIGI